MELIPSIIKNASMFNIWSIFILLFFVFIAYIGFNIIRKSYYINKFSKNKYNDVFDTNNKDYNLNDNISCSNNIYSKENMSIEAIENMISHLDEKISECKDKEKIEILTKNLNEYKRILNNRKENNLMGE